MPRNRRRRRVAAAAAVLAVLASAPLVAALVRSDQAAPTARESGYQLRAEEARELLGSNARQTTRGISLPVAREKAAAGREAGRELLGGPAAEDYANMALPRQTIDFAQVQAALAEAKGFASHGDSLEQDWEEVGPFTLDVAREATQTNGIPTQWSGRVTALAVDPKCDEHSCRLYVGAAGGGVWRTSNALGARPSWKPLTDGLDTTSVGALLIDPHDKSGRTIYLGTGEPSGSSDSEAGLGLYKSTDRGEHWKLVPGSRAVAKDRGIGQVVVDPRDRRHILIGTTVARHSLSGVSGGRFTPPNAPTIGVYESTDGGASFRLVLNRPQDPVDPTSATGNDFFKGGVTDLEYDPVDRRTLYAGMFEYGVFRSRDNGTTWESIYVGEPDDGALGALLGIRYEVAAAKLANGKTRLYVYEGANPNDNDGDGNLDEASFVLRTDDARAASPTFTNLSSSVDGTPGFSSFNICAAQCSYDMPIAVPEGKPNEVWIGGVTQYGELPPYPGADRSNGRNVLRSTNAGAHFTDMSGDARDPFEANHPDVQVLAFVPDSSPTIAFIGSDGGVMRTSGQYVNDSSDCDEPARNLSGIDLQDCRLWLSSVPRRLQTINDGLRTLQFQGLSPNPNDPLRDVIGGTQDNGTLGTNGGNGDWLNFVSGDGGQSGIDAKDGRIRYHTYFNAQGDVNFRGNDPQWWSWIFDPILFSLEGSAFYVPFIADPVVHKTAYTGAAHVWRTQSAGGDRDFLENHCSVLGGPRSDALNTGASSGCGDWVMLGTPSLIGTAFGPASDKGTGYVVATERAKTNTGTLWAATRRGRVFVAKNADSNDPAHRVSAPDPLGTGQLHTQTDVEFERIDTPTQPMRFISGISVDPRDPTGNTAFVAFSGYNAYTPATPGHVFKAVYNPATGSATWTNIDHNLGDLPILDVDVDPATGDLYAAYDYGVLRLRAGTNAWVRAADGLPKVAVFQLQLTGGKRAGDRTLYAATHGRGAFRIELPDRR
jgi:hypothetical protein